VPDGVFAISGYTLRVSDLVDDPVPYALVVGGLLLALLNAATTFRRSVSTAAFLSFARKKAEAGDHDRLRKLVSLLPASDVMALTRRWLELDLAAVVHAGAGGGYREAAEIVPVGERARAALAPYVEHRRDALRAQLPSSVVAACFVGAGMALRVRHPWVLGLGGVGALLAVYGGVGVWRLRRDLVVALDVLVTLPRPERSGAGPQADPQTDAPPPRRPQHLVVRPREGEPREVPLTPGVSKIGTLGSCDLRLEGEAVSRLHAVLEVDLDGATIIDLGSASGTWVNGERVDKCVLVRGDRVTIGDHEMEVV